MTKTQCQMDIISNKILHSIVVCSWQARSQVQMPLKTLDLFTNLWLGYQKKQWMTKHVWKVLLLRLLHFYSKNPFLYEVSFGDCDKGMHSREAAIICIRDCSWPLHLRRMWAPVFVFYILTSSFSMLLFLLHNWLLMPFNKTQMETCLLWGSAAHFSIPQLKVLPLFDIIWWQWFKMQVKLSNSKVRDTLKFVI